MAHGAQAQRVVHSRSFLKKSRGRSTLGRQASASACSAQIGKRCCQYARRSTVGPFRSGATPRISITLTPVKAQSLRFSMVAALRPGDTTLRRRDTMRRTDRARHTAVRGFRGRSNHRKNIPCVNSDYRSHVPRILQAVDDSQVEHQIAEHQRRTDDILLVRDLMGRIWRRRAIRLASVSCRSSCPHVVHMASAVAYTPTPAFAVLMPKRVVALLISQVLRRPLRLRS